LNTFTTLDPLFVPHLVGEEALVRLLIEGWDVDRILAGG